MKQHNKIQKIGDIMCAPVALDDTIVRGDRVSWSLGDGFPRAFGTVTRMTTKDYQRAYAVHEDGSDIARIIPARFITKECG
jgi:hypothetical protein